MAEVVFVVNPASGNGAAGKTWAQTRELATAWSADFLQAAAPSHVGPLLGRDAAAVAAQVAAWLSAQ